MLFDKVYIEISNICNLQCSFCPVVERDKKIMSAKDFEHTIQKVAPHAKMLTLHLMGEPLAHPEFEKILSIASNFSVPLNITSNGILIKRKSDILLKYSTSIHQVNFSLHSFFDNFKDRPIDQYLEDICVFAQKAILEKVYVNFRLWNIGVDESNEKILKYIEDRFEVSINRKVDTGHNKSKKIKEYLYLHFDDRFEWPALPKVKATQPVPGFCYGGSKQMAIHADGTVVPCCLDKEAGIDLGNIFEKNFDEIAKSDRASKLRQSFEQFVAHEPLCQNCQFRERFNKKIPKQYS